MKLGNWVCTYNTRRAAPCGPLSRRSAWLCFPTPRLPPSLQVRSYTSGSSRHRFSPIEVCSQAVEPARRRQPLRPPLGPAMPSYHARRRTVRTPPAQLRAIRPIALRSLRTRRRRLSDSPALPAHRQTEPSVPPSYFLPPAPRRPSHAPRRTRLRPYDTRAPPRALDSDRHPAPPPPDATLPSPPLRAAGRLPVSRGLARRHADSVAHLRACRPRPPQVPVTAQAAAAAREEHGTDPRGGEG